jgi:endoribonuclease L-PSP
MESMPPKSESLHLDPSSLIQSVTVPAKRTRLGVWLQIVSVVVAPDHYRYDPRDLSLAKIESESGRSFDDVVRAGVYLTSMSDFIAMNGIYAKYFSHLFPARTTIGVAALPLGACVEINLVVKA